MVSHNINNIHLLHNIYIYIIVISPFVVSFTSSYAFANLRGATKPLAIPISITSVINCSCLFGIYSVLPGPVSPRIVCC